MSKNKLLIIIFILAALVRFIGLNHLPPALNRDEATLGYNAYSILKTGRDEHGQFLPLTFKSIGDYKMPLYIYATIIPVKLFGLNDFSIRFWSALSGVISVIAVYFISKLLFTNYLLPITASFLLALNPWAVFYSRIAYEANLALMLFLLGLWLLLKKKPLGFIFWLLACLAYSSALIFIPLFLIPIIFKIRPKTIWLILFITAFALIFIKLWSVSSQKQNITIFSDPYLIDTYNRERTLQYQINPLQTRLFFNKYVYFGGLIGKNYLKTFSPQFLVLKGDNHPWHQIPGVGNFYFIEIIFALVGLIALLKSRHKNKLIFLTWLLLAPLASAITVDAPHSTRSLFLLPVIIILAALGFSKVKKFIPVIIFLYFLNVAYANYQYLEIYPTKVKASLPVGIKEQLLDLKAQNYSGQIYLTGIHDSAYLYPLVYLPVEPKTFQRTAVWTLPDTAGLTHAYRFSHIQIIDDLKDVSDNGVLIKAE